tara:strand:- start:1392 stop:1817 length:426 start_codon:yes stop_codon:yes gene_type:complete
MIDAIWQFILNNLALSVAWICAILSVCGFELYLKIYGPKKLTTSELSSLVNKKNGLVIDIREQSAFSTGHIPNAENILPSKLDTVVKQPNYRNKKLIIVCNSGQTAYSKALKLQKLGIKNITVLKGGMISWNSDNMPVVKN